MDVKTRLFLTVIVRLPRNLDMSWSGNLTFRIDNIQNMLTLQKNKVI